MTDSELYIPEAHQVSRLFRSPVQVRLAAVADHAQALAPAEKAASVRMASKRLNEFSSGRLCAKRALHQLLAVDSQGSYSSCSADIGVGEHREPLWPDGVVGSISHDNNRAVAVVANDPGCVSIGIDLHPLESLETAIRERISQPAELSMMVNALKQRMPALVAVGEDRLAGLAACVIFSIKESVFKCVYPVHRLWFGFSDASLAAVEDFSGTQTAADTVDPGADPIYFDFQMTFNPDFKQRLSEACALGADGKLPQGVSGRCLLRESIVVSAAEICREMAAA